MLVDVCWEGLVGQVVCVEVVRSVSDLVERGDVTVESAVRVVAFEPKRAAVVGVGGASGVLFLAVVDDGDAWMGMLACVEAVSSEKCRSYHQSRT